VSFFFIKEKKTKLLFYYGKIENTDKQTGEKGKGHNIIGCSDRL